METAKSPSDKTVLLQIAEKLMAAQRELDEFAVQLSLGKSEATDKFEEIKKEFSLRLQELKRILMAATQNEPVPDLREAIAALELELTLKKAGTRELVVAQIKNIITAMKAMEETIKGKVVNHPAMNDIVHEFEKFKMKLEILRLRFALKKFEVKDDFRAGMKEASHQIKSVITSAGIKLKKATGQYTDFRDEIREAYGHMKKAVKKI